MAEPSKFLIYGALSTNSNGEVVALMSRDAHLARSLSLAQHSHSSASSHFNLKVGTVPLRLDQVKENIEKLAIKSAMEPGNQLLIDARNEFLKAERAIEAAKEVKAAPKPSVEAAYA